MKSLRIFVDQSLPPDLLRRLQEATAGHELIFPRVPLTSVLAKAEPDPLFPTADIAFGQPDTEVVRNAPNLQWIQVSSAGITRYDNPDFRALAKERGFLVSNSSSVYREACALHTLAFILAQARMLPEALQSQAANGTEEWNALRASCLPLSGQKVIILGYGAIGERLAEMLSPLGMEVSAYRRRARGNEKIPVFTEDQLEEALSQADHVINILPDSAETQRYFNHARFALCKKGAVFYNIGRGLTVDQDALLEVLKSGHLRAAWLDVTDPEPLPADHPLRYQTNCHITPHTAGGHYREAATMLDHFLRNFRRFTSGEPLLDRVM